ncbi:MAG TPA: MBL fold metallo-hydrolase [Noviherbaspirillum sp.]|jgi:glyoxylase-like metal-dependent hydrolase (beta-lactamase superfamily II)|uniref:MBL fold metallo-hydrolase n=1 Tax=Noviherbaspirillum sp. TaxID=1926288 RepID=UPI002DDCE09B|nr:MBL fold metallo-hydrolase [Noviherbaspirillum sp.]HEV2611429.1 MBL fold metallo-hydrolase [Noviherbaspirillum sp.]
MKLPATMRVFERGWLSSNNILFIGRDDTALVDSGYATHAPQTVALVRHALQGRPLDRLINTHMHSDHCGGNAALQREYGCRTTIPASEAAAVRTWNQDVLTFELTGQQCERFTFTDTLAPGDVIMLGGMEWQVLGAPGHDPHSLVFYCPAERILISADALWENGFGVIFPELEGESGFAETRATLELIASLDVDLVIPGHGAPFTDVGAALKRAFSRLDYFVADPARNAQNAVKVLLKFLLLERQSIPLADVPRLMADMHLSAEANRRYLHQPPEDLAKWAVSQLVRACAAKVVDDQLVDAG